LWLIISELGYKPELDRCSLTKQERKLNQIAEYFDLNNGSICSRQAYFNSKDVNLNQDANIIPLDKLCFKLLKILDMNIPSFENKTLNDYLLETNFYSLIAEDDQLEQPFRQAFKLLAKHLEMQTHKVPKSFKALEEFL
jgi:recombinational DNA repair protein (RecF pathway)